MASLCLLLAATAQADGAAPFRTRNLNPPVAIFALPSWQPTADRVTVGTTFEIANHYRLSRADPDFLLLDGETLRLNLFAEIPLGERWSLGAQLPWVRQFGGVLDDTVDAWHSIFDLPDGGRNGRGEDLIEYRIGRGMVPMIAVDSAASALGDVTLSVARALGADRSWTLRFAAKLPTGDEAILAGSGSADWMVTLLKVRPFELPRRRALLYFGGGVVAPGRPDVLRLPPEDLVGTALLGGSIGVAPRLDFKAQLEIHTPFFDSPLEEIGQTAVQVSLGGSWAVSDSAVFDFAISEDLHVSTAPDVAIHAGIDWRW